MAAPDSSVHQPRSEYLPWKEGARLVKGEVLGFWSRVSYPTMAATELRAEPVSSVLGMFFLVPYLPALRAVDSPDRAGRMQGCSGKHERV